MLFVLLSSFIFGGLGFLWIYTSFLQSRYSHPLLRKARGLPILGNLLDVTASRMLGTILRFEREFGAFVEYYMVTVRVLLISDVETGKEILLKNPKKFVRVRRLEYGTKVLNMETSLFMSEGSVWTRVRKATSPSFSSLNVVNKFPAIAQEMLEWMKRMQKKLNESPSESPIFDMRFETFSLTIRVITIVGFGLPLDHPVNAYFLSRAAMDDMNLAFKFILDSAVYPLPRWTWKYSLHYQLEKEAVAANIRNDQNCQAIIDYKRKLCKDMKEIPKHQSMIDALLFYHDEASNSSSSSSSLVGEKALSDEEIIANMKTFYLAGTDTTAVTLTWVVFYFATKPEILQTVRKEVMSILFPSIAFEGLGALIDSPKMTELFANIDYSRMKDLFYCQAMLKETLRLKGPASSLGVELESRTEPLTLANGITIYPGDFVWVSLDGIHYSERYFSNPYEFQPERWLLADEKKLQELESRFIPFGFGPRACPGMHLANNEVLLGIVFLSMFFDFELACPINEIERIKNFASIANKMPMKLVAKSW